MFLALFELTVATSVTTAALPALPSGVHLSLREWDADRLTSAADLTSVGGSVWPCAAALCRWLLRNEAVVSGANVLDLGAGTGACGLYAAGLGAARVLLTDGRAELLGLQDENYRCNAPVFPESSR
eukprot:3753696-Prymnesium_polylepis.1